MMNKVLNLPGHPCRLRSGGTAGCDPLVCPALVRGSNDREG